MIIGIIQNRKIYLKLKIPIYKLCGYLKYLLIKYFKIKKKTEIYKQILIFKNRKT